MLHNRTVNDTVKHRYITFRLWAVLDVKFTWLYLIWSLVSSIWSLIEAMNISAFFIEDQRKIRMFVFKIVDVNMHAEQALLTVLNNVQGLPFQA